MKMNFIFYFVLLVVPCYSLVQEMSKPQPAILHKIHLVDDGYKLVSMYASDEGMKLHHELPENILSVATFKSTINENGWAKLSITTNPTHSNKKQAYAAGYLEGTATKSMIDDNWFNTIGDMCNPMSTFCLNLKKFLESNMEFMISMIKNNPDSPYWKQVELNLLQLQGLEDAYYGEAMNINSTLHLKPMGLILININGDLESLQTVLSEDHVNHHHVIGSGSCSALIKLLPGYKDLYAAHDTWSGYNSMLRIIKKYQLSYKDDNGELIPGHTSSFSSNPGSIFSGDDFYILSSGLTTIETTIGNNNPLLWNNVTPQSVLEWMRNLVANQLARHGEEWAATFKRFNSGTYNNQWMIVDYNKFTPGEKPKDGLLHVLEQLPGMCVHKDVTHILVENSYWASYNSPYFQEIFNASGLPALVAKYGNWFSHDKTPRALIFARDHSKVTDMNTMVKLMRYNDYQHDPLSACNCTPPYSAENAISARNDLMPADGSYPIPALGHRNHGATDVKVTTSEMRKTYEMIAECGPTHDTQPVFQWSKSSYVNTPHKGMPDVFDFKPVHFKWD